MSYFQTDDIPIYPQRKPKPLLKLISPKGGIILTSVQSHSIRHYYKLNHAPAGCNGKRVWREELTKLGYKIENVEHTT